MKIKVLTFSNMPDHPGLRALELSLIKHGWDYSIITGSWQGFGTKPQSVYNSLKDLEEHGYTHVLFTDAHDTVFLQSPDALNRQVFEPGFAYISAEKACWPDADRAPEYGYHTPPPSPWCYVNSGQYLMPIPMFREIFEFMPCEDREDDQRWLTTAYLSHRWKMILDINCKIFQSIAFPAMGDFMSKDGKLLNTITRTQPIAAHGNGKTPLEWLYNL
jgi:hypothetical protein